MPPLHVRLTDAERTQLEAAAVTRGLSLSAWVRMTLLDAARKVRKGAPDASR